MAHEAATAKLCRGCWEQMHVPIVLRGPLAAPYRLFGVRPSRMNRRKSASSGSALE